MAIRHRRCALLGKFLLLLSSYSLAQGVSQDEKALKALAERAQGGDTTVDFRELRILCTHLASCRPRSSKVELAQLESPDQQAIIRLGRELLAEEPANLELYATIAGAYQKLGDTPASSRYLGIVVGMLQSILRSGDGKTAETAFETISDREMYIVLTQMGLPYFGEWVASTGRADVGSHKIVRMQIRNPKDRQLVTIFFNIDAWTDQSTPY